MQDRCSTHLEAVYRILRHLKSTLGKGLLSQIVGMKIEAFTDADQAGSLDDRRSTLGYCTFIEIWSFRFVRNNTVVVR